MSKAGARVLVVGAGKMAKAAAGLMMGGGGQLSLWARSHDANRDWPKPLRVPIAADLTAACAHADVIFLAVPSSALPSLQPALAAAARGDHVVLHAIRGVVCDHHDDNDRIELPTSYLKRTTCWQQFGVLGGPLYVDDAVNGRPLSAVLATRFDRVLSTLRTITHGTRVRLHPSRDVLGLEMAGAVGNVAQVAQGMAEGLSLGSTAESMLLLHGMADAGRLAVRLGASPLTFAGLASVAELIPRNVTATRHHRAAAAAWVASQTSRDHQQLSSMEGVVGARALLRMAAHAGVPVPLVAAVVAAIDGTPPAVALEQVLRSDVDLRHLTGS